MQRETFVGGPASPGRGGTVLANERGGSHLAARHSVDGVVHEEDADFFAAICGVNDFRGADGGEIAITLIADDHALRIGALDGCGNSRSAAMSGLHVAEIKIVVSEDGTADGTDENGAVLTAEIGDGFGDELVNDAVAAAGAIMGLVL